MKEITKPHLNAHKIPHIFGAEKSFIKKMLNSSTKEKLSHVASEQAYIILSYILLESQSLNINSLLMTGFDKNELSKYLIEKGAIEENEKVDATILLGYLTTEKKAFIGEGQWRKSIDDFYTAY